MTGGMASRAEDGFLLDANKHLWGCSYQDSTSHLQAEDGLGLRTSTFESWCSQTVN